MRRFPVRFIRPESFVHNPSLADFIITTSGFEFSVHTGIIHDVGMMSLTVTLLALFGALAIWQIALRVGANFLFERPDPFWIAPKKTGRALQAAE
jgi:hypothetical protein